MVRESLWNTQRGRAEMGAMVPEGVSTKARDTDHMMGSITRSI